MKQVKLLNKHVYAWFDPGLLWFVCLGQYEYVVGELFIFGLKLHVKYSAFFFLKKST